VASPEVLITQLSRHGKPPNTYNTQVDSYK